jgi:hypothetical protein
MSRDTTQGSTKPTLAEKSFELQLFLHRQNTNTTTQPHHGETKAQPRQRVYGHSSRAPKQESQTRYRISVSEHHNDPNHSGVLRPRPPRHNRNHLPLEHRPILRHIPLQRPHNLHPVPRSLSPFSPNPQPNAKDNPRKRQHRRANKPLPPLRPRPKPLSHHHPRYPLPHKTRCGGEPNE